MPAGAAAAMRRLPARVRTQLMTVRALIFETAAATPGVGPLTETLKWREPAYLTVASGSGSTIRLARVTGADDRCAVLFNCRTTLVDRIRAQFGDALSFAGNRAILRDCARPLPAAPLAICLGMALTYHTSPRRRGASVPNTASLIS